MGLEIVRGEAVTFTIKLRDENGDPYDLTNFDKFKVCFPKAAGGVLQLTHVANTNGSIVELLGDAVLGKLQVTVDEADTALLNIDDRMDIDIELDATAEANPKRKRLVNVLTVISSLCDE